jgi:hypothetical protein
MLDCGGDFTSMDLLAKTNDSLSSVKILKQVLMLDRDDAYGYLLKSGVAKEDAAQIADLTHCEPPEDYFITSEDMVSKSGVWAHFGSWDFDKADMVLRVKSLSATEGKQLLMQRYNLSTQLADKYYYEIQTTDANQWIAGWPSYASTPSACIKGDELITCDNGLRFNLSDETAYADTTNGRMYPGSYSFIDEEGNFQVKTSNESLLLGSDNKPLGAAVYEQDGKYYNILMSPELTGCMFTRLFYFGGKDMTYFRLFTTENDIRNLKIIVWKVVW